MNRSFINKNKKPLILIIDYNPVNGSNIKARLPEETYDTYLVFDSKFVFDQVRNLNPDLIILNKEMPESDGFEICNFIKNIPIISQIPIIMILDCKNDNDINACFESGASDYMFLPINKVELKNKINHHIDYAESKNNERELSKYILCIESKMKHFSEIVSTCSYCTKIRDEDDTWIEIEKFLIDNFNIQFSHGICPDCLNENYPEISQEIVINKECNTSKSMS